MAHIHELYDFTVTIFIVNQGRILFVYHPRYGKWLPIGGHIELDEDPETALYREILEESGLEIKITGNKPNFVSEGVKPLITPDYMDVHEATNEHKHISMVYFASSESDAFVMSDEHE